MTWTEHFIAKVQVVEKDEKHNQHDIFAKSPVIKSVKHVFVKYLFSRTEAAVRPLGWHRPHKLHASLTKTSIKEIISRNVNWKALRMEQGTREFETVLATFYVKLSIGVNFVIQPVILVQGPCLLQMGMRGKSEANWGTVISRLMQSCFAKNVLTSWSFFAQSRAWIICALHISRIHSFLLTATDAWCSLLVSYHFLSSSYTLYTSWHFPDCLPCIM